MTDKRYAKAVYTVTIDVPQARLEVFRFIADLSSWWPEAFVGESLGPGAEFILHTGDDHSSRNKVLEWVPEEKLVWVTTESLRKVDHYDWSGSRFIFELSSQDSITTVAFTYDGVVYEGEFDVLVKVCDMTIREILLHRIMGKVSK